MTIVLFSVVIQPNNPLHLPIKTIEHLKLRYFLWSDCSNSDFLPLKSSWQGRQGAPWRRLHAVDTEYYSLNKKIKKKSMNSRIKRIWNSQIFWDGNEIILEDFCNIKFIFLLSPPNKISFSFSFSGTSELTKAGPSLVEFREATKNRARVIFVQWPWANCSNHTVISIDELPTQDTCPLRRILASC